MAQEYLEVIESIERLPDGNYRITGTKDGREISVVGDIDKVSLVIAMAAFQHECQTAQELVEDGGPDGEWPEIREHADGFWKNLKVRQHLEQMELSFPEVRDLDAEERFRNLAPIVPAFHKALDVLVAWAVVDPGGEGVKRAASWIMDVAEVLDCYTAPDYIHAAKYLRGVA